MSEVWRWCLWLWDRISRTLMKCLLAGPAWILKRTLCNIMERKTQNDNVIVQVGQTVKNLPAMQHTRVPSLGRENPLEEEVATPSSILAWSVPWPEEPDRLPSMGLQRVRHDWATFTSIHMLSRALSRILFHLSLMTVACHEYSPIQEMKKWKSEGFRAS